MTPPVIVMPQSWPETSSISLYNSMVYCWSLATFGSPLSVCIPPAECQVDPAVSSVRSSSTTSVHPAFVKWYSTLAPTTPPPITTTCVSRGRSTINVGFLDQKSVSTPPSITRRARNSLSSSRRLSGIGGSSWAAIIWCARRSARWCASRRPFSSQVS